MAQCFYTYLSTFYQDVTNETTSKTLYSTLEFACDAVENSMATLSTDTGTPILTTTRQEVANTFWNNNNTIYAEYGKVGKGAFEGLVYWIIRMRVER